MPRAGTNASIGFGSFTEIFNAADDGGGCTSFFVKPAAACLVVVNDLHTEAQAFPLGTDGQIFRNGHDGITSVKVRKLTTGTTSVDYGIVAKGVRRNYG